MTDGALQENPNSMTEETPSQPTLRLWPAVVLVIGLWLMRLWSVTGEFYLAKFFYGQFLAPMFVTAGLIVWWMFASWIRWIDRLQILVPLVVIAGATFLIARNNFPPMALFIYALPVLSTAWVVWLLVSIPARWPLRRAGLIGIFFTIGLVCSLRNFGCNRPTGRDFAARFVTVKFTECAFRLTGTSRRPENCGGIELAPAGRHSP
jgi:hypothetical protein